MEATQAQVPDKDADTPAADQQQVPTLQKFQRRVKVPSGQSGERAGDVPVAMHREMHSWQWSSTCHDQNRDEAGL